MSVVLDGSIVGYLGTARRHLFLAKRSAVFVLFRGGYASSWIRLVATASEMTFRYFLFKNGRLFRESSNKYKHSLYKMSEQLEDVLGAGDITSVLLCVAGLPVRSCGMVNEELSDDEAGMNSLLYEFKNRKWPFQIVDRKNAYAVYKNTIPALSRLIEAEVSYVVRYYPELQKYL